MLVEGAILDSEGPRSGYVRIERGRIVEVGKTGTASTHGKVRRVSGIVVPAPVNGHTHLGDAVSRREPPPVSFSELVQPPAGYKFRLLRETPRAEKVRAMRAALTRMGREGVVGTIDFREEGMGGIEELRSAAAGTGVRVTALGRPTSRPATRNEIDGLLRSADGIGISSAREVDRASRRAIAQGCRRAHKPYALHASEEVREPVDAYLDPRPDLLVHLTRAEASDLESVRDARVSVAVCPRSNALFGRRPLLRELERLDASVLIGTDNAMLNAPSLWRELEFAYVESRLVGAPVSSGFLARSALVTPWEWLGEPEKGHIAPGSPAEPLLLRLPPDDPAYQVVTRVTEQFIARPARLASTGPRRGIGR